MGHRGKSTWIREQLIEMAHQRGPSARLPTVRELCAQFGTTPATLDGVLAELEARQILWRRQGSGIFVSPRLLRRSVAIVFNPAYLRGMVASPFWSLLVDALQTAAHSRDIDASFHFGAVSLAEHELVPPPNQQPPTPAAPVYSGLQTEIRDRRVQGVLTIGMDGAAAAWFDAQSIPYVAFAGPGPHTVGIDYAALVHRMVDILAARGCRRIGLWLPIPAFLPHSSPVPYHHQTARQAFQSALENHGLSFDPALVRMNSERVPAGGGVVTATAQEQGYETACAVFGPGGDTPPPDGIVSGDDMMTVGAMAAFQELGVRVGEDVQFASHANVGSPVLRGYEDRIRLVSADPTAIAEKMLDLLDRLMAGEETSPENAALPPVS